MAGRDRPRDAPQNTGWVMRRRPQDRFNGPDEGEKRRRRPLILLFAIAGLGGAALWAYSPSLPQDMLIARYANERSRFVDIGGARAHVRDQGNPDGIPVILIHGANGSLHVWEGWAGAFRHQARLILVDLPGHGLTGACRATTTPLMPMPTLSRCWSTPSISIASWLVGHSLGGGVAWTFAATRPERVSQLILINSAGYPPDGGEAPWPTRVVRLPMVGDIGSYFKPELWVRQTLKQAYADPAMVTTERVKRIAELQRFPGNREASLRRARTQELLDPRPLKRLVVPTLILWGAKDRWLPVAYRFKDDIKGAKLEIFEKLGHDPMEEDAKGTVATVGLFLRPIAARAPSPAQSPAHSVLPESPGR